MEEVCVLVKLTVSRKTGIDKINTDCYKVLQKERPGTLMFLKALQVILMSAKVENHCPYPHLQKQTSLNCPIVRFHLFPNPHMPLPLLSNVHQGEIEGEKYLAKFLQS